MLQPAHLLLRSKSTGCQWLKTLNGSRTLFQAKSFQSRLLKLFLIFGYPVLLGMESLVLMTAGAAAAAASGGAIAITLASPSLWSERGKESGVQVTLVNAT